MIDEYRNKVRDADFKTQYDVMPLPDQQFEQAVGGTVSRPQPSRPAGVSGGLMWLPPLR